MILQTLNNYLIFVSKYGVWY